MARDTLARMFCSVNWLLPVTTTFASRPSATVIVMAEKGCELLRSVYDIAAEKIEVIPHGIPDCAFAEPEAAKLRRGFGGRAVILTFGLISPNKGIEIMIDAMPAILRQGLVRLGLLSTAR